MPDTPHNPAASDRVFRWFIICYIVVLALLTGWSLIGCTQPVTPEPPPATTSPVDEVEPARQPAGLKLTTEQQTLLNLHNGQRSEAAALTADAKLMEAANWHAQWMAENNIMSHDGEHGSTFWQRIQRTGYAPSMGGENIAAGYNTPASVFKGWMNSAGHRRNILNTSYTQIGMGDAIHKRTGKRFWCVVLAKPMRGGKAATVHVEELPVCLEGDESVYEGQ